MKQMLEIEEILERIKILAESYTPEWRFNQENPDIGTALASVYGEMLYQTGRRLPQMMPKSQIGLYNLFAADLKPAAAGEGYVTLSLVNEQVPGAVAERGTVLYGENDGQRVSVETCQSLFVTPAAVETVVQANEDFIGEAVPIADGKIKAVSGMAFFDCSGVNRQEYILYLNGSGVFDTREGEISICFHQQETELLAQEEFTEIRYASETGWQAFGQQWSENGHLFLRRVKGQPAPELMEAEGRRGMWIRFRVLKRELFAAFICKKITIKSSAFYLPPTAMFGAGIACDQVGYLPFGLEMGRFREAAWASSEALSKPGATVTLRFELTFRKTPLPGNMVREIEWKRVMKAKDLVQEPLYDITVEEVIWEYYNGKGWHRLFSDGTGSRIFTPEAAEENNAAVKSGRGYAGGYRELTFRCPDDLTITTVDSVESYYIRARVLTMKNEYKLNGYYITPVLSETTFSYAYMSDEILPEQIMIRHNLATRSFTGMELAREGVLPFAGTQVPCPSAYLKLSQAPLRGPVKILLQLEEMRMEKTLPLLWEYYSTGGWQKLEVTDETGNLRKTGLVTFMGSEDFCKTLFFAEEGYWIRISDRYGYYKDRKDYPVVTGIFINTVSARAVQNRETEYFRMDRYEPGRQFSLLRPGVLAAQLWIDEGEGESRWVLWEKRESFSASAPGDRHYVIDANEGQLRFGNGRYGKIPNVSKEDNIKVTYCTGGGEYTNIPAGTINRLEKSIGFISRVTNPLEFAGGSDRESIPLALTRNGALFKHRNRALTPEDFEELALDNFPEIFRAACFAGYNSRGKKEGGHITLVIAQNNLQNGHLYFEELKTRLDTFFHSRISCFLGGGDYFQILPARLVEVHVKVTTGVKNVEDIFDTVKGIEEICRNFLHPLYGNTHKKGWKIGEFPQPEQIKFRIGQEYDNVRKISINYLFCYGNRKEETSLEKVLSHPYILPISGTHQVVAEGGTYAAGY